MWEGRKDDMEIVCYKKVWSIGARVIYLTGDEEFEKLKAGKVALLSSGFPKEDVFKFDPALAADLV